MRALLKYTLVVALAVYLGVSYFVRSSDADGWGRAYQFEIPFIGGFNWWLLLDLPLIILTVFIYKRLDG